MIEIISGWDRDRETPREVVEQVLALVRLEVIAQLRVTALKRVIPKL